MAAVRRQTRNFLWNRRKSLGANLFNVFVLVPIISVLIVPLVALEWCRILVRRSRYVEIDGTDEQIRREAVRHAPLQYRWFGRTFAFEQLDEVLRGRTEWDELRPQVQTTDRIWPFTINPFTSAMRSGFVVVRHSKAIGIVLTEVS